MTVEPFAFLDVPLAELRAQWQALMTEPLDGLPRFAIEASLRQLAAELLARTAPPPPPPPPPPPQQPPPSWLPVIPPATWCADVVLPADGSPDGAVLDAADRHINAGERPRWVGRRALWAVIGAARALYPDGVFDPQDPATQEAVARHLGLTRGGARLKMARLVLGALAAQR